MTLDAGTVAIVRSVTALAHELDMTVTVEGIETPDQLVSADSVAACVG
jgi:EAL domain-containing protein (putative c-di-GMP-specific phosphodiesterase class I)